MLHFVYIVPVRSISASNFHSSRFSKPSTSKIWKPEHLDIALSVPKQAIKWFRVLLTTSYVEFRFIPSFKIGYCSAYGILCTLLYAFEWSEGHPYCDYHRRNYTSLQGLHTHTGRGWNPPCMPCLLRVHLRRCSYANYRRSEHQSQSFAMLSSFSQKWDESTQAVSGIGITMSMTNHLSGSPHAHACRLDEYNIPCTF